MAETNAPLEGRIASLVKIGLPVVAILSVALQYWQTGPSRSEVNDSLARTKALWETQPAAFPLDVLAAGYYIPTARSPIEAFDPGERPWLGSTLRLRLARLTRTQDQLGYDYFPAGKQAGLTAAFLFQLAIPLLAAWVCRRRTRSWLDVQIALMEIVAPALSLTLLSVALLNWKVLGADGAIRLILLLAVYSLYAFAAGSACFLLFSRVRDRNAAACLICFVCLFNIGLARPVSVNFASAFYPPPSLDEVARRVEAETKNGYSGVEPRRDREQRFVSEILADNKAATVDELKLNLSALVMKKEERFQREVSMRRFGELRSLFEKQERLEQAASLLFPFTAIQIASSALAATDFRAEREQAQDADVYWDALARRVYEDLGAASGPEGEKVLRGPEYWRRVPAYRAELPNVARGLGTCLLPCIAFALWTLGGFFYRNRDAGEAAA